MNFRDKQSKVEFWSSLAVFSISSLQIYFTGQTYLLYFFFHLSVQEHVIIMSDGRKDRLGNSNKQKRKTLL